MNGQGTINWWGYSPGFDPLQYLPTEETETEHVQLLLIGAGDPRLLLHCLASNKLSAGVTIYVLETYPEQYGRLLLLLQLALQKEVNILDRVDALIDVWSNILIYPETHKLIANVSKMLQQKITDESEYNTLLGFASADELLHKERDDIDSYFARCRQVNSLMFNFCRAWEERLRQLWGKRYDHRHSEAEWSWFLRLRPRLLLLTSKNTKSTQEKRTQENKPELNSQDIYAFTGWQKEYFKWRETGQAYRLTEYDDSSVANVTLTTEIARNKLSYSGSVISGPYPGLSLITPNEALCFPVDGVYGTSAVDVARQNTMDLVTKVSNNVGRISSSKTGKDSFPLLRDKNGSTSASESTNKKELERHFRIVLLSPERFQKHNRLAKIKGHISGVYLSSSKTHLINCTKLREFFRSGTRLWVEDVMMFPELSDSQVRQYGKNVVEKATAAGWLPIKDSSPPMHFSFQWEGT